MESGMMIDRIMAVADEGFEVGGRQRDRGGARKKPTSPKIREKWGTRRISQLRLERTEGPEVFPELW
jgi:hypothetical protein